VLGSFANQVLRHASCPVLTVGPEVTPSLVDHDKLSHILFATDFSEGSLHALRYALSLAEENDAELTLMHVLVEFQPSLLEHAKEFLADYRKRLWDLVQTDAAMWCKPHVALETGAAAEAIVRTAHDRTVDLIVMGVHSGGTVATHLPWTVVHSVVRHTRCPVLTTLGSAA
jgi:nucleotide-binding universal stress UspA family protein